MHEKPRQSRGTSADGADGSAGELAGLVSCDWAGPLTAPVPSRKIASDYDRRL